MYALRCECGETIPVAVRQAGNDVVCPACSRQRTVPKLGALRQLPKLDAPLAPEPPGRSLAMGKRVAFAALGLVAGIGLLFGGFALIKAATIHVESTTEAHIARDLAQLEQTPPNQVIALWRENMRYGLGERRPFPYQQHANEKAAWQRGGYIGLGIAAVAVLLAALVARSGRLEETPAQTDPATAPPAN